MSCKIGGMTARELFRLALEPKGFTKDEEVDDFLANYWTARWMSKDLAALIKQIHASGYRLAILSNHMEILPQLLKEKCSDILHCFAPEAILNSWDLKLCKPQPEIFEKTAELLKVKHSEIYFVDDKVSNTSVAEQFGWRCFEYKQDVDALRRHLALNGVKLVEADSKKQ